MTDSKKSTNFRMDRLLRDSQSENILQQQPQNNFWPNTPNLTPNISTTSIPPSSFISSSSQQNVYYSPNIYNSINQQHFFNSFNPSSPLFIPNWPTFLSSPSNNNNNNPLATALVQALLQNQFINQIQKQQISSLFQQITPPSINSTPGTSNSESSGNTNLNNLTSIKYPNNIRSTNVFGKTTNTPLQPKVVEKASQDKNISTRKYVKRVQKKNEIKETPKPRKTTNVLINNNNNVQKAQCD
uniref:Uncharacterized protein n=1 Tax=Meloidogyne hapla TaxID=6305 RepID=A0A1I8BII4_MELHA